MNDDERASDNRLDEDDAAYWHRRAAEQLARANQTTLPDAAAAHRAIAATYTERADRATPRRVALRLAASTDCPPRGAE